MRIITNICRLFVTRREAISRGTLLLVLSFLVYPVAQVQGEVGTRNAAPRIMLRDVNNKLVICNEVLKKKPILISFFFTDCRPCRKEIPELEKLKEKYGNRVQFYLIATDRNGADALKPYIQKMNITIPVLLDPYQDAVNDFGVTKYPTLYIIGRDGKVRYACFGYDPKNIEKIEEVIKTKL